MSIEGFSKNNINNGLKKYCYSCGNANEHGDIFCSFCGASLSGEDVPKNENVNNFKYVNNNNDAINNVDNSANYSGYNYIPSENRSGMFNERNYADKNGLSAKITTMDWIKVFCLNLLSLIPLVGGLVYLVLMIVLCFKDGVAESIKNYCRAQLLVNVVLTVFCFVLFFLFFSVLGVSLANLLETSNPSVSYY